jgi:ABC-2 type transport system permease protein
MSEQRAAYDVAHLPLTSPSATSGLLEVFRRRYLLTLLVRREIMARYQGTVLGLIWSYVNPLSQFLIYWFVIGKILNLHKQVEQFAIHIFCGLIVVHFFNETMNAGTRSIVKNKSLVQKMAVPREMFPVASMLVSAFHVGPQLVILTIACAWLGWIPDPAGMVGFVIALLIAMTLGIAIALTLSCANVFLRDISNALSIMTNLVRFGVPMIWSYSMADERLGAVGAQLVLYNPLAIAVLLIQRAFWIGTTEHPDLSNATEMPDHLLERGLIALAIGLVLLVVGQKVFTRLEGKVPERL